MKRILFVDDESAVLEGLKNLLHKQRHRWDIVFAEGGKEALNEIRSKEYDIIISDIRMSSMDGIELLNRVKDEAPNVIRLVLSGQVSSDELARVMPVAHQFLSKPTNARDLQSVIEKACALQSQLPNEMIKRLIGSIDRLPTPPITYIKITQAMAKSDLSISDIVEILEQDPAVCAKLLQLVNYSYFGLSRPLTNIAQSVSFLGLSFIKNLVLVAHLLRSLDDSPKALNHFYNEFQSHSLLTAKIAQRIIKDVTRDEVRIQECVTAALLHDIGKIIIAKAFPEDFAIISMNGDHIDEQERALVGATHAEVGAYLLSLWGLPSQIVDAVAHHHAPANSVPHSFEIVDCVHMADMLVQNCDSIAECLSVIENNPFNEFNISDKLPIWQALVEQELHASGGNRNKI